MRYWIVAKPEWTWSCVSSSGNMDATVILLSKRYRSGQTVFFVFAEQCGYIFQMCHPIWWLRKSGDLIGSVYIINRHDGHSLQLAMPSRGGSFGLPANGCPCHTTICEIDHFGGSAASPVLPFNPKGFCNVLHNLTKALSNRNHKPIAIMGLVERFREIHSRL